MLTGLLPGTTVPPKIFKLFAAGVAEPVFAVKVKAVFTEVIVITLPDPEVVVPPEPNISIVLPTGVAEPKSVTKVVGTSGGRILD